MSYPLIVKLNAGSKLQSFNKKNNKIKVKVNLNQKRALAYVFSSTFKQILKQRYNQKIVYLINKAKKSKIEKQSLKIRKLLLYFFAREFSIMYSTAILRSRVSKRFQIPYNKLNVMFNFSTESLCYDLK